MSKYRIRDLQYIIIGSNNFWYASGLTSIDDVVDELENIKKDVSEYGNPETNELENEKPSQLYVYEARELENLSCDLED